MTKEDKYREEMLALGTWNTAFIPTVHDLCVLEREVSRARAAWKRTAPPGQAPSPLDPHYAVIRAMSKDIVTLREILGLTPRSLRRIKGFDTAEGTNEKVPELTILDEVRSKYA